MLITEPDVLNDCWCRPKTLDILEYLISLVQTAVSVHARLVVVGQGRLLTHQVTQVEASPEGGGGLAQPQEISS